MNSTCHYCDLVAGASEAAIIYADDTWIATCVGDVPGWLVFGTRRHADDWLWGLAGAEQASFGPLVTRLSSAIREVTAASHVYLIGLGELSPHFHTMLVPRTDNDMRIERAVHGVLQDQFAELADPDRAFEYAALLRAKL